MRVPTEDLREEAETPVGFATNCGGPSSVILRANLPRVGWFEVPSPLHYRPLPPARVFESYAGPSGEQNEWIRVIRRRSLAPAKGSRVTISSPCFTYASLWRRLSPAQNRVYIFAEAGSDAEIGDYSGLIPGPVARSLKGSWDVVEAGNEKPGNGGRRDHWPRSLHGSEKLLAYHKRHTLHPLGTAGGEVLGHDTGQPCFPSQMLLSYAGTYCTSQTSKFGLGLF